MFYSSFMRMKTGEALSLAEGRLSHPLLPGLPSG